MIDLRQLRYFVALAETLHFGRAAERLHVSQPPLSRQIAALEADLGVRLLERNSRAAALTHAGQRFLEDARAVLGMFDQACRNARMADRGEMGELSIGFMMHAAYTVVPGLARRFMAAYPGVHLALREVVPSSLPGDLLAGRFDAGILFDPGPVRGLDRRVIHRERLSLAVPSGHRLALAEAVSAKDLDGEPMIVTPVEVAPTLRSVIEAYCRSGGFAPVIRLEASLQQTIVSLVAEGLGVALVPESMRRLSVGGVVLREVEKAPEVEQVVGWKVGNLNPALGSFLGMA
jgi:DNA-binding transcriptional LysR family regulator